LAIPIFAGLFYKLFSEFERKKAVKHIFLLFYDLKYKRNIQFDFFNTAKDALRLCFKHRQKY